MSGKLNLENWHYFLADKPHVILSGSKLNHSIGKVVRMRCVGTGDGPMTSQWMKDEEYVTKGQR